MRSNRSGKKVGRVAQPGSGRAVYYSLGLGLALLSLAYCGWVFRAGQYQGTALGSCFVLGVPNYYIFYAIVLPFILVGVLYLALRSGHIRIVGKLKPGLPAAVEAKVYRFRKVLLVVAMLVGVFITGVDTLNRDHTLPPFAFALPADRSEDVARWYACAKQWLECGRPNPAVTCGAATTLPSTATADAASRNSEEYLLKLRAEGLARSTASGFESLADWYQASSLLSKFETLLSLLGATIVAVFFAQVLLLVIIKDHAQPSTKNLTMWLVVLASLWFPAKLYSAWYFGLAPAQPGIALFGFLILLLGAVLVFFISIGRDEIYKYVVIAITTLAGAFTSLAYFTPELLSSGGTLLQELGWGYGAATLLVLALALYFVTDHFITSHELDAQTEHT